MRADDANVYLLRHDATTDEWMLQALDRSEQLPLSEEDKVKAQQSEPNRPGTTDLSQLLRGGLGCQILLPEYAPLAPTERISTGKSACAKAHRQQYPKLLGRSEFAGSQARSSEPVATNQ